jgi:hypothetical protein
MGKKNEIIKTVHRKLKREVNKIKAQTVKDLAREILTLPLSARIKMAYRIVFKGRL